MRLFICFFAFSFSAKAAVPQTNGCERAEAGLLQEEDACVLEEEFAALSLPVAGESGPAADCAPAQGRQDQSENSQKENDLFSNEEEEEPVRLAALPVVFIGIGAVAGLLSGCHEEGKKGKKKARDFKPRDYRSPLGGDFDSCKRGCIDEGGGVGECKRSCEGY